MQTSTRTFSERHRQILLAAVELIAERGYAGASLRTLAAILPFRLRPTSAAGALLIPAAARRRLGEGGTIKIRPELITVAIRPPYTACTCTQHTQAQKNAVPKRPRGVGTAAACAST